MSDSINEVPTVSNTTISVTAAPSWRWRVFQIGYAILAANFLLPVIGYIAAPDSAAASFISLSTMFGVENYAWSEESRFWYVLGVGNVATLGFCCLLVLWNFKRFEPVVVPLVFLKACSVVGFGIAFIADPMPSFLIASVFDGLTCAAFLWLAHLARTHLSMQMIVDEQAVSA